MESLIPITQDQERITVSARELYNFLEVGTEFRHWIKRMFEYGFEEDADYTPVIFDHPQNQQPTTDYQLTLDCAKEIAMIQRNDKGKEARKYFIEIEKEYRNPLRQFGVPTSFPEALKLAALQAEELERKEAEVRQHKLLAHNALVDVQRRNEVIQKLKPKAIFADAVATSNTSILVGELAKILKQNGIEMGQNRLFQWLRENGYLISRKGTDYNMPTQRSMELELFEIKETAINHSDGHVSVSKTPKVKGKGQTYFINKFLNL